MFTLKAPPEELGERNNASLLTGILRGVEREALRVSKDGSFSMKTHPPGLGSALTHPLITTDFSEALLEFITPPTHTIDALMEHLDAIHRYAIQQLDDEILWTSSMPCQLPTDADIPVARYGRSHNGQMKTAYRVGLGHRYGRNMQTVSGLHYNFSLPDAFWAHFHCQDNSLLSLQTYKNQRYFGLIRNFRRYYWLLILLFGASPALCSTFIGNRHHNLENFDGNKALYRPYATSLRMGDLGYQSSAQESLKICYNQKQTYIKTLSGAILQPHHEYQRTPIKDANGNYRQLNQGLLQIENEFYSAIRPKRSAKPGETALTALKKRGVEYVEIRCLDINPFTPLGINQEQVAFLDTFLLYCTLMHSPESDTKEFDLILSNQKAVVNEGRRPNLQLEHREHGRITCREWGSHLMTAMQPVAEFLDKAFESSLYSVSLSRQQRAIENTELTPSASLLRQLAEGEQNYLELSLQLSLEHAHHLRNNPLDDVTMKRFEDMSVESVMEQTAIEAACHGSFDAYLENYFKQYQLL